MLDEREFLEKVMSVHICILKAKTDGRKGEGSA